MAWHEILLLFGASVLAGAVNSVAGGGTLLTFPALLAVGQTALIANATNTVALWPGQLSSLFGYRAEIGQTRSSAVPLSLVGLAGGVLGAYLLIVTPSKVFDQLVPYLVLLATALFMVQEPLSRWLRARAQKAAAPEASATPASAAAPATDAAPAVDPAPPEFRLVVIPLVLVIAVYGGYFGAGIGILTLATLGFLGFRNIHQMNGVKAIFTLFVNGVAAGIFLFEHLVDWRRAGLMAVGSVIGGYSGAGVARRIGQKNVRRVVVGIGLALTISLLIRAYG